MVAVPHDHTIQEKLDKIPDRFACQKPLKDWTIEGPFHDEEAEVYYFMLKCPSLNILHQVDIPETDFFLSPGAVEGWVSRMIAKVMEAELGMGVAQRLMGKSNAEVKESGTDEIITVEDYSRGTGSVHRRQLSRDDDGVASGNKGGLILPP